jgi:regulator of sigma E protease
METSIERGVLYPILTLIALISASLGIFNLLPIPALDGGRILFSLIEMIRQEPLTPALQEKIHMITMMLLVLLFIVITAMDIIAPVPVPGT